MNLPGEHRGLRGRATISSASGVLEKAVALNQNGEMQVHHTKYANLSRYSERGLAYVEEIQSMIEHNELQEYNKIRSL
jgi:uncharacterized FlgJ-related protein